MTLAARDITFGYDDQPVVADISLTVTDGTVLAIIGPSGVGKTTLLRLLAMFQPPDRGTIASRDEDVWALSESERRAHRRELGMVFQSPWLFDGTVAQNVTYGPRVRQSWFRRVRNRLFGRAETNGASDDLELVGLEELADRSVRELSGGERQRVAFARAMAYDPRVLLLDEPTSDLDPRNTAIIEDAIAAACDRGLGVVLATHDMHQAERVADRVAVLIGETIVEIGPTERVFESPEAAVTRRFIDGELIHR